MSSNLPDDAWAHVPLQPPSGDRKLELRGLARGLRRAPALAFRRASVPRGAGEPVMVVPGFMSGDRATAVLRGWLRSLGYAAQPWGVGFNTGQVERLLPRAELELDALAERSGAAVRLVGWSLGGVIARELARRRPELVEASQLELGFCPDVLELVARCLR